MLNEICSFSFHSQRNRESFFGSIKLYFSEKLKLCKTVCSQPFIRATLINKKDIVIDILVFCCGRDGSVIVFLCRVLHAVRK